MTSLPRTNGFVVLARIGFAGVMFLACWALPRVASAQAGRYELHGDVVLDRHTGLEWKRCSVGRTLRNRHCMGRERRFTWFEAAGYRDGDWRAPTPEELYSLWQQDGSGDPRRPNIDTAAFPDVPMNARSDFWTTEPRNCVGDARQGCGLTVDFMTHAADVIWPNIQKHTRLPLLVVRPGRSADPAEPNSETTERPTMSADRRFRLRGGEAEDTRTKLVWLRCPASTTYSASRGCVGVMRSYTLSDARELGGDGWRLPTKDELLTLVVNRSGGPPLKINQTVFYMGKLSQQFWTSTIYSGSHGKQVWCIDFDFGNGTNCGEYPRMVRLVRSRS